MPRNGITWINSLIKFELGITRCFKIQYTLRLPFFKRVNKFNSLAIDDMITHAS